MISLIIIWLFTNVRIPVKHKISMICFIPLFFYKYTQIKDSIKDKGPDLIKPGPLSIFKD